jgi:ABC-type branched-subunit amino acid transport system substrate-binding protein
MTSGAALGWMTLDPEISVPFTDKTLPFLAKLKARKAGMMNSTYPSYDSPWILKAAAESAKTLQAEVLIKALESGEARRIWYTWKFNKCHDPVTGYPPYATMQWGQFQENGKVVALYPTEIAQQINPNNKFVRVKDLRAKSGK